MARKKANTTKLEILQVATALFLEKGYSATTVKAIADRLEISTGHLTFYFPTKEHLLAAMVEILCNFQWVMIRQAVDEGQSRLMAVCLELMSMAAACEEDEIIREFYVSAYTHPMTLEIIRKNDAHRSKLVFGDFCPDWTDEDFTEAETLVSGIEYATLMTTGDSAAVDVRIAGALNNIMQIYGVPEQIRKQKLQKVLAMDYVTIGRRILREFREYIEQVNEQAVEDLLRK